MAAKKKKKVDTWKTKKWYTLIAPPVFDEKNLGETLAPDASSLKGRTIKVSLGELLGKRSQQYIGLEFEITEVKKDKAFTSVKAHKIQRGYLGRQARRMKTLISTVIPVKTKDGKKLQLQVLCLSKGKMDQKQRKAIREMTVKFLTGKANKTPFEKLFQDIIFGKASTELSSKVKKIYPIYRLEVTKTKILE
jgi:small subunit ribosomal protein S3Ae